MRIQELRDKVDDFLTELTRETYQAMAGIKEEARISAIYDKYSECFQRDSLELIEAEFESAKDEYEKRRLKLLREFVALSYLDHKVRGIREEVLNREARAEVEHPEGPIPFRLSFIKLKNEPLREAREKISRSQEDVIKGLEPLLKRGEEIIQEECPSYIDMFHELSGIALEPLNEMGRQFLKDTEDAYREHLSWFLRRNLKLKPSQAKRHDMEFLLRGMEYDPHFPERDLMELASKLVLRMGMDLRAEGKIRFDMEPRPRKTPRAFCAAVRVPEEVYLTVAPAGGYKSYHDFLHELGHALHHAYVSPEEPMEFKRLGDYSVTEAYAFIFDRLMLSPVALKKSFGIAPDKDMMRFFTFGELYLLRRYFAKLSYELELHKATPLEGKDEIYQGLLSKATGVEYPKALYLYDVDPHFYCARYLRAWLAEATLYFYLRDRYDEDWFRSERAGAFLRELFSRGQRYMIDEIIADLAVRPPKEGAGGGEKMRLEPLKERVLEHLG